MGKFIRTKKMRFYMVKFALRLSAFGVMIWLYFKDKQKFYNYIEQSPKDGFNFMHFMWVVFMGLMLSHLFPTRAHSMGAGKTSNYNYDPVPEYSKMELMTFVQNENVKAWKSMTIWLCGNALIGAIHFIGWIGKAELLLISGFYFISDYICILIFCPFQTFFQRDRCCVNCRIYDWGHFMMFTPMLFIKTFYTWSLFFMGLVVIIHWEIMWTKHPERFWHGSNKTLRCVNCKDQTCKIKRTVTKKITRIFLIDDRRNP